MKQLHEANRLSWNEAADGWKKRGDKRGLWNRCHRDPTLVLTSTELTYLSNIQGKDVCVLGSGDNEVVFALAGMGTKVTSIDISERQLETAKERAGFLGLDVSFLRADVTDLRNVGDGSFNLVYTGGHVAVWVSDLKKYYSEASRILKPGGLFVVNEYHPFRRVWDVESEHLVLQHDYFDRGPSEYQSGEGFPQFEFHWTVADYIQAVLDAGFDLLLVDEHGEEEHEYWMKADLRKLPMDILMVGRKRLSGNTALPSRLYGLVQTGDLQNREDEQCLT